MSQNELSTTSEGEGQRLEDQYLALQPESNIGEILASNVGEDASISIRDLVSVPTPSSGATRWSIQTIAGEESVEEIVGILAYHQPYGSLWPSDDPVEGTPPLLVTNDFRVAKKIGDDYGDLDPDAIEAARRADGYYDWKRIPYTEMGSGKKGIGKRAKEGRILCLIRPGDALPTILRVGPGSAGAVQQFLMQLTGARLFYYQAVIGISLEKKTSRGGQNFSKMKFRLVDKLTPEQGQAVRDQYTKPLEASLSRDFESVNSGGEDSLD